MSRAFILMVCLAALAGVAFPPSKQPAVAQTRTAVPKPTGLILPPVQYDRPYTAGNLIIEEVDTIAQLQARCYHTKWLLGCSFLQQTNTCRIILVKEEVMKQYGWTRELMLRHEHGHCNGWPGDHPGQRPAP